MKTIFLLLLLFISSGLVAQTATIVDHQHTDLSQIPDEWIDAAQANLRVHYFRASHGSQVDDGGMTALENYFGDKYKFRAYESTNSLFFTTSTECVDCDYTDNWVADTRTYLDNAANADVNTVMWAWSFNFYGYVVQSYLDSMEDLIAEYGPGGTKIISGDRTVPVTFVFQTACSLMGNVQNKKIFDGNVLIKQHCIDNNRVLFDYNDIECYNPDGEYFGEADVNGDYLGEKRLDDDCSYIINPADPNTRGNWGTEWIDANPTSELALLANSSNCTSCAHSQGDGAEEDSRLHCVLKGQAIWWLWAKLAGWDTKSAEIVPNQALTESNLNVSSVILTLSGEIFADGTLSSGNFQLNNAPSGTSIQSVLYGSTTTATINLDFDGTDFDTDYSNFTVTVSANELSGTENITSNNITISAVVEPGDPSLQISTTSNLTESTLNNKVVSLELSNLTFSDGTLDKNNFQLNNIPAGLSILSVDYVQSNSANITLSFDGTDFDTDYSNFTVTISANELSGTENITSNNITISAVVEPGDPSLQISTTSNLTESTLNNKVVSLELSNLTFSDGTLDENNFQLNNIPAGLSVLSVDYVQSNSANITLFFDGTNFDTDYSNFTVTVSANEINQASSITSNQLSIIAELEPNAILVPDSQLIESELNDANLHINLDNETFDSRISIADLSLNNAPVGLSIAEVNYQDGTNLDVTLSFDNTNFDNNIDDFSVTILANALSGTENITTNEKLIVAETVSSIEEIGIVNSIQVFPNPSTGLFKLKLDLEHQSTFMIDIIDLSGKTVWSNNYEGNVGINIIEFDLTGIKAGVKMIFLKFADKQVVLPIIIE